MPVNVALTAGEQTNLNAGPSTVKTYLSPVANTVYATATVLSNPSFPVAGIAVSGTSANWLTVPRGATVQITDSTATIVRGYYRARLDVSGVVTTAGVIYVNEIGQGDPGLLVQDIRNAAIQANDLITVYQRWDGWAILPRIVYSGVGSALIFEDFNRTYSNENQFPGPATAIIVKRASDAANGMPGAWAWRVDSGQSYATLQFNIIDYEWPSAGAVTFAWTVPAGWTITGGSISTNTITAQVPAQAGNYILQCVVSEANGGSTTRYIPVWCYNFTTFSPISVTDVANYTKDRTSAKVTLGLNNNGLASIPDGTLVCMWDEATFNGAIVPSASRFVNGFVSRENRQMEPGLRGVELEIVGPGQLLASMNANSQYLTAVTGTPANWQSITTTLSYIDFIMYWVISRRTTLLYMFDYVTLGIPSTQWRMPAWDIPTGNVLQQMQNLAQRFGGNFGSDAAGQFVVRQHPSYTTYSTRGSNIVTRDVLNASNYNSAPVVRELKPRIRKSRGEAFFWTGTVGILPAAMLSDAPDTVPGQGSSEDVLQSQVVTGQIELNERTGMRFSAMNNPFQVTVSLPYNRDVIEPAQMQFVSLNVPAYLSPDNIGYTKNIVPTSVSKRYSSGGGSAEITLQAEFETTGLPGKYVQVPVPVSTLAGQYSSLPITSSLPPASSSVWGGQTNFVPTRILAFGPDGTAARGTPLNASPTWTSIDMPAATRNSLCGSNSGINGNNRAFHDATQNPYDATEVVVLGATGIALLNNAFSGTAAWTTTAVTPAANYVFGAKFGSGTNLDNWGKVEGSINVQNYFGWYEIPTGAGNVFYAYTTDHFATKNRVDTGIAWATNYLVSISLGCFANAVGNINVFMSIGGSVIRSTNGGASWSTYTYPFTHLGAGEHYSIINMPFSLPGGGNNSSYANLLAFENEHEAPPGTVTPWFVGKGNTEGSGPTHGSIAAYGSTTRTVNTLTIDANSIAVYYGGRLYTAADGGLTWIQRAMAGVGSPTPRASAINGWPTNPNFLIGCSNNSFWFTTDRGDSVTNITQIPNTTEHMALAFADFSEVYPTGGVHP